ncbi:MAG: DUF4372 domain-containing protein [Alphaproteobacteria bacterium]|nr:DUF4372 domain-containing protein [Alphaproteobacteria bacterium]
MNVEQTLFSQLMDCLPWSTFGRIVARHGGERREVADLDRRVGLRPGRHRAEAAEAAGIALHIDAGVFGDSIRRGPIASTALGAAYGFDPVMDHNQSHLFSPGCPFNRS